MLTFSINEEYKDKEKKMEQTIELLIQGQKPENANYLKYMSDIYLNIMTGKTNKINLKSFAKGEQKYEKLRAHEKMVNREVSLEGLVEQSSSTLSCFISPLNVEEQAIENILKEHDFDTQVERFKSVRSQILTEKHIDLWEQMQAAMRKSKKARNTVQKIMQEYDLNEFLPDLFSSMENMRTVENLLAG